MVKEMTGGATVMAMEQDVPALKNMTPGSKPHPVDRVLHDGDQVKLGGSTLTAHLTPGHTRGCTTWTMRVPDGGRTYDVVIVCAGLQDSARLVNNKNYPGDCRRLRAERQDVQDTSGGRVSRRAQLVLRSRREARETRERHQSLHRSRGLQGVGRQHGQEPQLHAGRAAKEPADELDPTPEFTSTLVTLLSIGLILLGYSFLLLCSGCGAQVSCCPLPSG